MKLMGVDVGYSTTRLTTGIACLDGDQLSLVRTGTEWASRKTRIPGGFQPALIALDGPLLPRGADMLIRRPCESVFIHAPFHNRCKPGLCHWGWGLELRRASADACAQFSRLLGSSVSDKEELPVSRSGSIVEAFPNGFLGVLMPEEELLAATQVEARAAVRLAVRSDGNERKVGVRAVQRPGISPGSLAPLELRDGPRTAGGAHLPADCSARGSS
jgi:hypothetical protein